MKMSADKKALLKWLRGRLRESDQRTRENVKCREYGEAQLGEGIAQAYAFTIIHVEREMS